MTGVQTDTRLEDTPAGPRPVRDVGGETYYGRPVGAPGSHQYPPCPHPGCRALVPVPEDATGGGTYRCVCGACHSVASAKDAQAELAMLLPEAEALGA